MPRTWVIGFGSGSVAVFVEYIDYDENDRENRTVVAQIKGAPVSREEAQRQLQEIVMSAQRALADLGGDEHSGKS
jgi:hypothetical protein